MLEEYLSRENEGSKALPNGDFWLEIWYYTYKPRAAYVCGMILVFVLLVE